MKPFINSAEELQQWFYGLAGMNDHWFKRALADGVLVSTKVRKDYLCSKHQGKLIIKGSVAKATFKNLGGGVYKASVNYDSL